MFFAHFRSDSRETTLLLNKRVNTCLFRQRQFYLSTSLGEPTDQLTDGRTSYKVARTQKKKNASFILVFDMIH